MDKQKKNKQKDKFFVCFSLPVILLILAIGTSVMFYLAHSGHTKPETWASVILVIMFLIFPWFSIFYSIMLFWPTVTICETGIERKLFGCLFKRKLLWDELLEIRILNVPTGGAWLFFSTRNLEGMSIGKARTRKGKIQVMLTDKVLVAIRKHSEKEIIDLPADLEPKKKSDSHS